MPFDMLHRITAPGPVRYIVAPTRMHVWRLEEWHALFPDAELWMPPHIPNKFKRLPFVGILGDVPPQIWAYDLDQLVFKGNCFIEEVFFFHKESRTVILADFIQNHPMVRGRPLLNALFKFAGVAFPHGGVPRDIRLSFTNRNLARRSLGKLLSWDFDKLIIAHGVCIEKDAKAIRRAGLPMPRALISASQLSLGSPACPFDESRHELAMPKVRSSRDHVADNSGVFTHKEPSASFTMIMRVVNVIPTARPGGPPMTDTFSANA